MKYENLIGKRYGNLIIRGIFHKDFLTQIRIAARYECDCGAIGETVIYNILKGSTTGCPECGHREAAKANLKHGRSHDPMYSVWSGMKDRCNNENADSYRHYGGRGISVCKRWFDFNNFLEDMGERPDGLTIERINNDGNYEPSNCRWATVLEQMQNTRRNKYYMVDGKKVTQTGLAKIAGISHQLCAVRVNAGWSVEEIINTKSGEGHVIGLKHGKKRGRISDMERLELKLKELYGADYIPLK